MKEQLMLTNELLLALLSQTYSIELLLADVFNGKANLRYSNASLDKDKELLELLTKLVRSSTKENLKDGES